MSEIITLSHYEIRLLAKIEASGPLCMEVDYSEEGIKNGGFRYWLRATGRVVGSTSCRSLIKKQKLQPLSEGLLDKSLSQEWGIIL